MAATSQKLRTRLDNLNACVDELEKELEPLLSQTLPETVVGLDPIQQAKLHVLLPYLTNGLLFVYLKTQGIDPKTHAVVQELERVKGYFNKIREAETPAKRTLAVDKDAATRFIQSAIRQATGPQQAAQPPVSTSSGSSSATIAPVKVTDKMRARAEYQAKMKDEDVEDTDEDEDLQVIDESTSEPQSLKRAGKEKAVEHPASSTLPIKRQKRTAMDVIDSVEAITKNDATLGPQTGNKDLKKKRKKPRKSSDTP